MITEEKHDSKVIEEKISNYIENTFNKDKKLLIDAKFLLLSNGVIDSLSLMTLILYIEKEFKIDFYKRSINIDDFKSIEAIINLIISAQGDN